MPIQNFKVNIQGAEVKNVKLITFEKITNYIKGMGLEENVTTALLNKAKSIPAGSLEHFLNNIQTYVANLTRETHGTKT